MSGSWLGGLGFGAERASASEKSKSIEPKPLHVRVAEALGCKPMEVAGVWYDEAEADAAEAHSDPFSARPIPHYDTEWSATGPLIERYNIRLRTRGVGGTDAKHPGHVDYWEARAFGIKARAEGLTPLVAVCNLILAFHAAGKLPK